MRRPRGGRRRYRGNYYYRDGEKSPLVKAPDAFALRRDGHAPAGGGEDGLAALRMADAVYEAARSGALRHFESGQAARAVLGAGQYHGGPRSSGAQRSGCG